MLLRNPWGDQKAITENKGGYFFIKVEDYLKAMDYTYINYDTTDWHQGFFMMQNDPAEENGTTYVCGNKCTQHRLFVKSAVKQKVFVGTHTYPSYTYPDAVGQCPASKYDPQLKYADMDTLSTVAEENSRLNLITNLKDMKYKTFSFGAGWLEAIEFEEGEEV